MDPDTWAMTLLFFFDGWFAKDKLWSFIPSITWIDNGLIPNIHSMNEVSLLIIQDTASMSFQ
jgi:hypothetical protein